jgi:formylmethanofuran dehydrogenase subunit E
MATDYDAPRRGDVDELNEDSIEELKARRAEAQSGSIDVDETELAESLELPGADLSSMSGEELTVRVLPKQSDEFTCSSCFLVHHRSQLAFEKNGQPVCTECAA